MSKITLTAEGFARVDRTISFDQIRFSTTNRTCEFRSKGIIVATMDLPYIGEKDVFILTDIKGKSKVNTINA